MGKLDGLRDGIATLHIPRPTLNTERGANIAVSHALALIDAYERDHPRLEDRTIKCCRCGRPGNSLDHEWYYDHAVMQRPIPLEKARVCPECREWDDIRDD